MMANERKFQLPNPQSPYLSIYIVVIIIIWIVIVGGDAVSRHDHHPRWGFLAIVPISPSRYHPKDFALCETNRLDDLYSAVKRKLLKIDKAVFHTGETTLMVLVVAATVVKPTIATTVTQLTHWVVVMRVTEIRVRSCGCKRNVRRLICGCWCLRGSVWYGLCAYKN